MTTAAPVTVALDKERRLVFDNRARYRLGTAPTPFSYADLSDKRRAYAALCAWIWACLVPEDARDFASPENVATFIGTENQGAVTDALVKAIEAAAASEKNGHGSTPKPSPSSSSA